MLAVLRAPFEGCLKPQVTDDAACARGMPSDVALPPGGRASVAGGAGSHTAARRSEHSRKGIVSVYSIDAMMHAHDHTWAPVEPKPRRGTAPGAQAKGQPHARSAHHHHHHRVQHSRINHSGNWDFPDDAHANAQWLRTSARRNSTPAVAQVHQRRAAAAARPSAQPSATATPEAPMSPQASAPAAVITAHAAAALLPSPPPELVSGPLGGEADDAREAPQHAVAEAAPML